MLNFVDEEPEHYRQSKISLMIITIICINIKDWKENVNLFLLVNHLGSDWWVAMKFLTDVYGPQRIETLGIEFEWWFPDI